MPDPEAAARASLRRSMLIYLLLLAVDLLVVVSIAVNGESGGAFVTLSIVGLVGLLLAYHVLQHIQDLGSPLAESEGVINRLWTRADLIIAWQSYYMLVGRTVFRVKPEDYIRLKTEMYVKVVHFPRTLNVVTVHEAPRGIPPG
jgi:xanthosine utilization system XapX-like protein